MSRLPAVYVVMTVAIVMAACGGDSPGPASPSVTSPSVTRPADPTFTVSGTVTGGAGTPIEGAQVRVAGRSGITDGNGDYSLQGVPASYGGALAVKAGYAAARNVLTVSSDTQFDFQLGPPIAIHTLSGVVSEETPFGLVPVEGVRVTQYSCEDLTPSPPFFPGNVCLAPISQDTRTDKNGRYSFSGLYAGKANLVSLVKEGYDDPRVDPNGPEGNGEDVTIAGDTRLDLQLVRR